MSRPTWTVCLCGLTAALAGCANRLELGAINNFSTALAAKDSAQLEQLKGATSAEFEQKALRLDDAVEDLKVLRLPTGKTEIISVHDESPSEKTVVAKVGDSKRKLTYRLVKDGKTHKWVVDDVFIKQKRDGVDAVKSVTEQMDLLLSVREFLRSWDSDDRNAALAVTTPAFRATLDALPPAYFAQLAAQVVGGKKGMSKVKPEAQLDDNVAVVKIPRPSGQMLLTYEMKEDVWRVSDIAIESKGDNEHIPSVQKYALALTAGVGFLQAYANDDREALTRLCTTKFYASGLAPADLSTVPLPAGDVPMPKQQFKLAAKRAEMLVPTETELVKVSLVREESPDADTPVKFRVEDVTLYELDGSQEKRLSSMFTANAMLMLFAEALGSRELPMLRKSSTADFNRRVWDRLKQSGPAGTVPLDAGSSQTTIDDLPLGEIPPDPPQVLSTKFNGAVTEIVVMQGDEKLTYLLREVTGEVRVDDILLPAPGRPRSLKETAELIVPLREFIAGLQYRNLRLIQRSSSNDYNRLVWKQTDRVPELTAAALRHLRAPVTELNAKPEEVLITLGDDQWGAKVRMVKEYSKLVVDDVQLIAGLEARHRMRLKTAMRQELAGALPAGAVDDIDERTVMRPNFVNRANFEQYADESPADEHRIERPAPAEMDEEAEDLSPPEPSDNAFETPPADEETDPIPAPRPNVQPALHRDHRRK